MRSPSELSQRALYERLVAWDKSEEAKAAGISHYNFNQGALSALAWVLGEDVEPMIRWKFLNTKRTGPKDL